VDIGVDLPLVRVQPIPGAFFAPELLEDMLVHDELGYGGLVAYLRTLAGAYSRLARPFGA
jgi:hypothetical protein